MNKFKKYAALLLALCMTLGTASFAVACGGGDETSSSSSESTASSEEPATQITLTLQVVTEHGDKVEGVTFEIKKTTGRRPTELVTDAEGKATFTGDAAEYQLTHTGGLPVYHVNDDWTYGVQTLELTESQTLTLTLFDVTPDGSAERPFTFLPDEQTGDMTVTVPANGKHYYTLYKAVGKNLLIESESLETVEVTYENVTYKPLNGILSVPTVLDDTYDSARFLLKNTSDSEITLTMKLTSANTTEGSLERPFALTLGETAATVTGTDAVYYRWTATGTGTLTLTCDNASAEIQLQNNTQSIVSNEWTLRVTENDVVYVLVSVKDANADTNVQITFQTTFA